MIRPGVLVTAGVCGLLAVGVGINYFRSSDSAVPRSPKPAALAKATANERGWIARSDPAAVAGGAAREPGRTGSAGTMSGDDRRGRESDRAGAVEGDKSNRDGATVISGTGPSRGGVTGAYRPGSGPAEGNSIQVSSGVPAAGIPFEGALSVSPETRREQLARRAAAEAVHGGGDKPNASAAPADENEPVLSLPLTNKSAEPENSDTAVFHQGVEFDSEGAVFNTDSQFIVPNGGNIKGEGGSIAFWMQPQWGGGDEGDASLVQLRDPDVWDNRLQIFKNGRYLRFLFTDNTGQERNVAAVIDGWQPGEWHQVTATWGEALQSFYVDGRLIGQQTYAGQLDVRPGTPLYIGSDLPRGGPSAGAAISNFQVYGKPVAPDVVSNLASSRK